MPDAAMPRRFEDGLHGTEPAAAPFVAEPTRSSGSSASRYFVVVRGGTASRALSANFPARLHGAGQALHNGVHAQRPRTILLGNAGGPGLG
jgi:hypothetical protein